MARFSDKVVIVTGAGSGIGAATAKRFAEEGASVALAGRTAGKLQAVAKDLHAHRTLVQPTDVSEQAEVEALIIATVARFGRLDVLVNNAGVAAFTPLLQTSAQDWRRLMGIDVDGVYYGVFAALPHLLKTGGSVVNVSSVSGLRGDWNMSAYNAAKGAVSNFTRSLALELGGQGVRVNAVAPSLTRSEMSGDLVDDPAFLKLFANRCPLGRAAEPEEVAAVIAFLAGPDASFVNGVVLPVDGGVSASNGQPHGG